MLDRDIARSLVSLSIFCWSSPRVGVSSSGGRKVVPCPGLQVFLPTSVFSRVRGLMFAGCKLILIDAHLAAAWPIFPHLSHVVSGCLYWSRSSGQL